MQKPYFTHRSCYVNFAEHLQNRWNPNMFFSGAPNRWSASDWHDFLRMIKAFGFNCFEYWVPPTLVCPPALANDGIYADFAARMRVVTDTAHRIGLRTCMLISPVCFGPEWYFPCPRERDDRRMILKLFRHWLDAIPGTDIVSIFPGDPGGCNRNGCDHRTFIDLALELSNIIQSVNPETITQVGTWGTPFSGWGDDLLRIPGWDGSWAGITDSKRWPKGVSCHIWNGDPRRADVAMKYLCRRLPSFPDKTWVAVNLGYSPDGDATMGGDARHHARAVAAIRPITTWDYSLTEGELVCYPHWRLPRLAARRREERTAAPYIGGMAYTMMPKLSQLTMYAAGRLFQNPDADPDILSREFCGKVFGNEHRILGELFEAFEVVTGWGHYPRRKWSKEVLRIRYREIIERLEAADMTTCKLPLFPDPERYRQDLLWFARQFYSLAGSTPDRKKIRDAYYRKAISIYDHIPRSADDRRTAADRFGAILKDHVASFGGL